MEGNIQNCCRICLDVELKHVSILEDSLIHLQVKSCLPITVSLNDSLPKSICETCVSQLNNFYNFQLNARCSQDWLESSVQKTSKNPSDNKPLVQPLPDSEYNSDSLLEFLNSTANIEEYLNSLGKEDIPCIVNMLDKTDTCYNTKSVVNKTVKLPSPKKKNNPLLTDMDIDVLDSDIAIVKELLMKETEPKKQLKSSDKTCFGCKLHFDNIKKLSLHLSICDLAFRTCIYCNKLFDSKIQMQQHILTHTQKLQNCALVVSKDQQKNKLSNDQITMLGYVYSCKQCEETFQSHFELYKHIKKHVLKSDERVCDICGHKFIGDEALIKHRKVEHQKPKNFLYRCKVCSFTSEERKQIYSHVLRHTQVRESNRHLCESCGQSFATQATLLRHSQQHGIKFSKCKVCNKKFRDSKMYDKHLLEHIHLIICERCGKSITSLELDKHGCI